MEEEREEATITHMVKAAPLRIVGAIHVGITKVHCLVWDVGRYQQLLVEYE